MHPNEKMHNQNVLQHICTIFLCYYIFLFISYIYIHTSFRKCTENCFVFHYSDSMLWNEKTSKKNDNISCDVYCATPSRTKIVLKIDENWMSFREIRTHEMEKKKKKKRKIPDAEFRIERSIFQSCRSPRFPFWKSCTVFS